MKLIVDHSSRFAKMRAHTATHLLHSQLAKFFPNTKQEGSQVDSDYLRFDFSSDRLLSPDEISEIEKNINQIIYLACDIDVQEMTIDEASKLGAKMFFEDKYGDKVRVVQITSHSEHSEESSLKGSISIELCGGTHVANTKDIGCFTIIGQEAVASGIKRITALTGPKVLEKVQEVQSILDMTVNKLGIKTATQLEDKLDKTLREYEEMQSKIESMETKIITQQLLVLPGEGEMAKPEGFSEFNKIIKIDSDLNFKNIVFHAKSLFPEQNVLVYNQDGSFVILTNGKSAKELASNLGLKGGGNENMVQGRDPKVLEIYK